MTVKLLTDWTDPDNGRKYRVGNLLTKDSNTETGLIAQHVADSNTAGGTAWVSPSENKSDQAVVVGPLDSGEWQRIPSIWRLRINGTGTITLDSRDAAGTITAGYASYTYSAAVNAIEWPYPGADAVDIRANITGSLTAEVL